jgi:hypothetical protein
MADTKKEEEAQKRKKKAAALAATAIGSVLAPQAAEVLVQKETPPTPTKELKPGEFGHQPSRYETVKAPKGIKDLIKESLAKAFGIKTARAAVEEGPSSGTSGSTVLTDTTTGEPTGPSSGTPVTLPPEDQEAINAGQPAPPQPSGTPISGSGDATGQGAPPYDWSRHGEKEYREAQVQGRDLSNRRDVDVRTEEGRYVLTTNTYQQTQGGTWIFMGKWSELDDLLRQTGYLTKTTGVTETERVAAWDAYFAKRDGIVIALNHNLDKGLFSQISWLQGKYTQIKVHVAYTPLTKAEFDSLKNIEKPDKKADKKLVFEAFEGFKAAMVGAKITPLSDLIVLNVQAAKTAQVTEQELEIIRAMLNAGKISTVSPAQSPQQIIFPSKSKTPALPEFKLPDLKKKK